MSRHESQLLRLRRAVNAEEKLTSLARQMSRDLVETSHYTQEALRQFAIIRMEADEELAEAANEIGVPFDRLINAVRLS